MESGEVRRSPDDERWSLQVVSSSNGDSKTQCRTSLARSAKLRGTIWARLTTELIRGRGVGTEHTFLIGGGQVELGKR